MRLLAIRIALGITVLGALQAQVRVPLVTGPLSPQDRAANLEAEIIAIGPSEAYPNVINRPAGKFILILQTRDADPGMALVLEAVTADASKAPPILHLNLARSKRGLLGGAVELRPGKYQLKSSRGDILCQISAR